MDMRESVYIHNIGIGGTFIYILTWKAYRKGNLFHLNKLTFGTHTDVPSRFVCWNVLFPAIGISTREWVIVDGCGVADTMVIMVVVVVVFVIGLSKRTLRQFTSVRYTILAFASELFRVTNAVRSHFVWLIHLVILFDPSFYLASDDNNNNNEDDNPDWIQQMRGVCICQDTIP